MRLRLSSVALFLMFVVAIIGGVLFYIQDNDIAFNLFRRDSSTPSPQPDGIANNEPFTSITPTLFAPPPTPGPQPTSVASANLREIPADTTIFIPRAAIYSHVIQAYLDGTSWDVSKLGTHVGHLEGTAWVDQPGNVVLSGHVEMSDGRPGVFANLGELQVDDFIELQSGNEVHRYVVREIRFTVPNDLEPILPSTTDQLTLITCNAYDFFTDTYEERMIVVAERVG